MIAINNIKKTMVATIIGLSLMTVSVANADEYKIDKSHSFIEFGTMHFGFSILKGRFNSFDGTINYKPDGGSNSVNIEIDMNSVDSNWSRRDKHLRSADFFDVTTFPTATFKSEIVDLNNDSIVLNGDLTLHGVTKKVTINAIKLGSGKDPRGVMRVGFKGSFSINRSDYGISKNLGPKSEKVDLTLYIEAIKQ